jgi:hypothetical protein
VVLVLFEMKTLKGAQPVKEVKAKSGFGAL